MAAPLGAALLDVESAMATELPGQVPAAVLVAMWLGTEVPIEECLRVVFTVRRADLRRHAGEVSFPGGRRDADDRDLAATALREADEEIGLPAHAVRIVGALPPTSTFVTNYAIYPFVGLFASRRSWRPSEHEVDEVIEVTLSDLRASAGTTTITRRGMTFQTPAYQAGARVIWGATARIVDHLLERTAALRAQSAA